MYLGLILSVVIAALPCLGQSTTHVPALSIGVLGAFSETASDEAIVSLGEIRRSLLELNARGGLGGRALELRTYDTKGTVLGVADLIRRAAKEQVVALIGFLSSNEAEIAVPLSEKSRLPLFLAHSVAEGQIQKTKFTAALSSHSGKEAGALTKYIRGPLQVRHAVIVVDPSERYYLEFSQSLRRKFEQDGGTVLKTEYIRPGSRDFTSVISMIRSFQHLPDVLIVAGGAVDAAHLMEKMSAAGIQMLIAGNNAWRGKAASLVREQAAKSGWKVAVPSIAPFDAPSVVRMLIRGLQEAGSVDPVLLMRKLSIPKVQPFEYSVLKKVEAE